MLPVYLIWVWQRDASFKRLLMALLLICSITLVTATPFFVWNPAGFIKSIFFSATRQPESDVNILSLDARFGLIGLPAKIPMVVLLLLLYTGVWQQAIRKFTAGLLTMTVFIAFNSVFFTKYLIWAAPFFPLLICDYGPQRPSNAAMKS
jgi:hypothetical protein